MNKLFCFENKITNIKMNSADNIALTYRLEKIFCINFIYLQFNI